MPRNSSRSDRFRRPAGSGTSTSGAGMSLAEIDRQRRLQALEDALNKDSGGFLGTGIGPDINLGFGRLWDEISGGVTGLVRIALPGSKEGEAGWADLGKGLASSLVGTGETFVKPVFDLVDLAGDVTGLYEQDLEDKYERFVGRMLGDEETYKARDLWENVRDRGLLPALAETIGNVSLAGSAITAPVKGASWGARAVGAERTAQSLMLRHANLINKPVIRAMQHPYRTAARALDRSWVQPGAARFNAAQGIDTRPLHQRPIEDIEADMPDTGIDFPSVRVSDDLQTRLAQAYEEMPDSDAVRLPPELDAADARLTSALDQAWANLAKYAEQHGLEAPPPRAPDATASYRAFVAETNEQFRHLTEDLGYKVEFVDEDPYPNAAAMAKDVRENKRIKVMRTKDGEHPYLTPEENDRFRAVHDIYGHAGTGQDFSRHGEEAAFLAHSSMYSPAAQKALASETRGQNAVLIKTGDFGPQKASLLPDELADPSESAAMHRKAPPEPPRPGDALAAAIDRRVQGLRSHLKAREQTRLAEMERDIAARSPAVRAGVRTAEDMVLRKAQAAGRRMTRQQASAMVGEEIYARYTGLKALETAYPNVPKDVWVRLGLRQHFIPEDLWDAELEGSLLGAVDLQKAEHARVREILESGRQGDTGLTGLADEDAIAPGLTRRQTRELRNAQKMLERAESEVLARKEAREARVREGRAAALEDRLARLAEEKQRLLDDDAAAVEAFDHSRAGKIKAFSTPERKAAAIQSIYDRTMAEVEANGGWGGASYNPHTERFIVPGEDTGYAVGLVKGTALEVPLEQFTPEHIDLVVRAHQDVFQHPNVVVGTWVEDGKVYIDPSEIVESRADAFVRAAAREQLSIFDVAKVDVPSGILKHRPDLADALLTRNRYMNARAREFEALTEVTGLKPEDFPAWLEMNLTLAAAAVDKGVVSHPDEFFQKYVLKPAKRPSTKKGVLRQIVLERVINKDLYDEATAVLDDVAAARDWYFSSHRMVEELFRGDGSANVTLGDGTKINAADLFYDILAITSINASPSANLAKAFTIMGRMEKVPKRQINAIKSAMKKVVSGKATLEEAFGLIEGSKISDRFRAAHGPMYDTTRQYLTEVFAGHTIDKWTPDSINAANRGFGGNQNLLDRARAIEYLEEHHPDVLERLGPDAAVRELFGRAHRAKLVNFRNNLRDPANSFDVTIDAQMERLVGELMPDSAPGPKGTFNDAWIRHSEDVRRLAEQLSEISGERVMPSEVQAVLWLYTKQEVNRIQVGHFNALVADAYELVSRGQPLVEGADPISTWIDEAGGPYLEAHRQALAAKEVKRRNRGKAKVDKEPVPKVQGRFEGKRRILGESGETIENVVVRPSWGAGSKAEKAAQWTRRQARWNLVREQINASLAVGDIDEAMKTLDEYATHVRTSAPRYGGLAEDTAAGSFLDIWNTTTRDDVLSGAAELDRLNGRTPGVDTLFQAFEEHILGEFMPMADEARGIIRIFEKGNLQTLVHEQGHLLRRLLPDADMRAVERVYGVEPGKAWPVAAEERFANDLVRYMISEKAPKGLGRAFHKVREALAAVWKFAKATWERGRIHPDLKPVFDSWFEPALRDLPDQGPYPGLDVAPETGTMRQRAARPPRLPQPPNKAGDFYAAGRKGQAALARLEKNAMKRRALTVAEQKTQKALDDIRTVLAEGRLPSALERDALRAKAAKTMERINKELATPSVTRTPTRWQPLWHAVQDIAKEAETNPALADMLPDLPETLYEVQRLALEQGFDPVHFREFSPTQVRRLVWGNMRLGKGGDLSHEAPAGTRSKRTGALRRQRGVDKSLEAFYAATVEAIAEKRTNAVIDWVETEAARTIETGTPVPEGWVLWDPVRTYLLTGTEMSEDGLRQIQTAADHLTIVPESVSKTLYRFSKDYDHWSVRAIRKVTSPWRTLVLTFSPGWYVRNIVGNVILAESEGVLLRDWKAAWRSAKAKDEIGRFADIPFVTSHTLADEAGLMADASLIPRTLADAQVESGTLRGTLAHGLRSLLRVNEVVDEFARAAVYHQGLRLNMTPEQAWARAKTALVDYSALSGFERSVVRSVIPFYAWQKGILKVTLNQAIDHPARTSILMLLGQMQEEYVADLFGVEPQDVPDFYKHMIGDRNVRSFNPFSDPAEITTPEGIMRSLNPFLEIVVRKGLGAPEFYTDERRVGFFGTPQQDVNVPAELRQLVTRSPGGRIISEGSGSNLFGTMPSQVDLDLLRSRFLKTRETVRGIPNPETEQQGLLPRRP